MVKTKIKIGLLASSFLLLMVGISETVHADPPSISFCTENSTMTSNTKLCKGGSWVTCDNSHSGQKSTDGTLTCNATSGKWEEGNPQSPDNSCPTNGDVNSDNSKICQSKSWVLCDGSTEGDTISGKQCTNGEWITPDSNGGGNNDDNNNGNNGNPQSPTVKITKVTVYPLGFNPTIDNTKITYTISQKAVIDLKITNSLGQTVATLVDNKSLNSGSYFVNWYGTKDNVLGGMILNSGAYHYKLVAKNPKDNTVADSKEGTITLIFASGEPILDPVDPETKQATEDSKTQAAATLALQNTKKGKTTKVGPDILLYSLFPVAGYVLARRKK